MEQIEAACTGAHAHCCVAGMQGAVMMEDAAVFAACGSGRRQYVAVCTVQGCTAAVWPAGGLFTLQGPGQPAEVTYALLLVDMRPVVPCSTVMPCIYAQRVK